MKRWIFIVTPVIVIGALAATRGLIGPKAISSDSVAQTQHQQATTPTIPEVTSVSTEAPISDQINSIEGTQSLTAYKRQFQASPPTTNSAPTTSNDVFSPSEEVSEDLSISFPTDI